MATEIGFYQMTSGRIETVLPRLLERILAAGMRAVLRSGDEAMLRLLDERLWTYADDSFLPHGLAGGSHDAAQPVLLTSGADVPNDAQACVLLDAVLPDDCTRFERVLLLFDGANAGATAAARAAWRQAGALAGTSRSYHTQSPGGGWVTSG